MSDLPQLRLFHLEPDVGAGWKLGAGGRVVCQLCRQGRTPEGHDPCIANTPGVLFACCGHGIISVEGLTGGPYVVLTTLGGPPSDVELFAFPEDLLSDRAALRGETLIGAPALKKLRELRGEPA